MAEDEWVVIKGLKNGGCESESLAEDSGKEDSGKGSSSSSSSGGDTVTLGGSKGASVSDTLTSDVSDPVCSLISITSTLSCFSVSSELAGLLS